MKIRLICALLLTACFAAYTFAQTRHTQKREKASFAQYRESMLKGFSDHRNRVLSDYQKYLDGIWESHPQAPSESRYQEPKPQYAPVEETAQPIIMHETTTEPQLHTSAPAIESAAKTLQSGNIGVINSLTSMSNRNTDSMDETVMRFKYYGMDVELPQHPFDIRRTLSQPRDYAMQWRELNSAKIADTVLPSILDKAQEMGLNDFFTFQLIKAWANAKFPMYDESTRMSLIHYLLANAGFDTRIALGDDGVTMLLIACEQRIYGRTSVDLNGTHYNIFANDDSYCGHDKMGISTCRLPDDADLGRKMDLHVTQLNIPYSPKPYSVEYGDIKIAGEVNANLFPMLYRYPQVQMDCYAESCADMDLRADVTRQISEALANKDGIEAIDELLHFVQSGFQYATDQQNHGFEKPYFFEEMLYYDKCDCEDRAIFYTYLLWDVLGVPCHLITYPDHESVAVNVGSKIEGTFYHYDGADFYISDPTYIGSKTGQCMGEYRSTSPKIDYEYK